VFAAFHRRREVWVGLPTAVAIVANRIAPGWLDRYLARSGYAGQLTREPNPPDAPANLFDSVPGDYGAHGRFDARAKDASVEFAASKHRGALACGLLAIASMAVAAIIAAERRRPLSLVARGRRRRLSSVARERRLLSLRGPGRSKLG